MAFVGLDPFGPVAAGDRADTLLVGTRVEPVPVQAARIGRVFEHRLDRRLRPFARGVAASIDVAGWGRAARAVQVVGDLLVTGAREEAVENLGDDRGGFGIGDEPGLLVASS